MRLGFTNNMQKPAHGAAAARIQDDGRQRTSGDDGRQARRPRVPLFDPYFGVRAAERRASFEGRAHVPFQIYDTTDTTGGWR
jgi:hypothetical protein